MNRFWDIWLRKMSGPWNRGQRSLKVIGTDTYRSATYDFLLTFYSNHWPISHRFRDRRRFQSKIANFPTPCILRPRWMGSPWNCVSVHGVKNSSDGATGPNKKSDDIFSLVDTTTPTWQTDRQTDRQARFYRGGGG